LIPGMPNIAFLLLGATCGGAAWLMVKREREAQERVAKAAADVPPPAAAPAERLELGWEDVASVDPLGLEVGYRLIPLVDTHQGGELMGR
ncbi:FHIPEP family type III secretion protein, partial [Salmonella enterica]